MKLAELKERVYKEYSYGVHVKVLAKWYEKSVSSIYSYIAEMRDKFEYPILKEQLKDVLKFGNLETYFASLNYSQICLLSKRLGTYGNTRNDKINRLCIHLKKYSILGLYPEHLNKEIIKRAYYQKAKETHPDLNKEKNDKEFMSVFNAYQEIIKVW